jgi:hypothetical protein
VDPAHAGLRRTWFKASSASAVPVWPIRPRRTAPRSSARSGPVPRSAAGPRWSRRCPAPRDGSANLVHLLSHPSRTFLIQPRPGRFARPGRAASGLDRISRRAYRMSHPTGEYESRLFTPDCRIPPFCPAAFLNMGGGPVEGFNLHRGKQCVSTRSARDLRGSVPPPPSTAPERRPVTSSRTGPSKLCQQCYVPQEPGSLSV